jgi:hypothetical protein
LSFCLRGSAANVQQKVIEETKLIRDEERNNGQNARRFPAGRRALLFHGQRHRRPDSEASASVLQPYRFKPA